MNNLSELSLADLRALLKYIDAYFLRNKKPWSEELAKMVRFDNAVVTEIRNRIDNLKNSI